MISNLNGIAAEPNWPIMLPFAVLLLAIGFGPLIAQLPLGAPLPPTLRGADRRGLRLSPVRRPVYKFSCAWRAFWKAQS